MSSTFGNKFKVTLFGESHSSGLGVTIDGIPSGFSLQFKAIEEGLYRRAPQDAMSSTGRREDNTYSILCGYFNEHATGAPLTIIMQNKDVHSGDYNSDIPRPSHADYVAHEKYGGFNDYRGGGQFSGRLSAPFVFAGEVARQILSAKGIVITSFIKQLGNIKNVNKEDGLTSEMYYLLTAAKMQGDSVGGIISCQIAGAFNYIGEPYFDSLESVISHIVFSIPAVKGIEFGDGFRFAESFGSECNDEYKMENDKITLTSNHNGGIIGGIANGMPITFNVAVKPTPSIFVPQHSVSIAKKEDVKLTINGRHDASIVPRVGVIVECAAAIAIANLI